MAWKVSQYKLADFFPTTVTDRSGKSHSFVSASIFTDGYAIGKYLKHHTYLIRRLGFEYLEEQIEGTYPFFRGEVNREYSVSLHQAEGVNHTPAEGETPKKRKDQELIIFNLDNSTAEIIAFPFLKGRIYNFLLNGHRLYGCGGNLFFVFDIPTKTHSVYTPDIPLPSKSECVGIYLLLGQYFAVFKSITTRHVELWNLQKASRIVSFDSANEENLLSVGVKDPGFFYAHSSKNIYVWDLRTKPVIPTPVKCAVSNPISSIAFGDDHFVGGDFDGNLVVMDTISGKSIFEFEIEEQTKTLDVSQRVSGIELIFGHALVASSSGMKLVRLKKGLRTTEISTIPISSLSFCREGSVFYAITTKDEANPTQFVLMCKFSLDRLQTSSDITQHPLLTELCSDPVFQTNVLLTLEGELDYAPARSLLAHIMRSPDSDIFAFFAAAAGVDFHTPKFRDKHKSIGKHLRMFGMKEPASWEVALAPTSPVSIMLVYYLEHYLKGFMRPLFEPLVEKVSNSKRGMESEELIKLLIELVEHLEVPNCIPHHVRRLLYTVINVYLEGTTSEEEKARARHDFTYRIFFQRYLASLLAKPSRLDPFWEPKTPVIAASFATLACAIGGLIHTKMGPYMRSYSNVVLIAITEAKLRPRISAIANSLPLPPTGHDSPRVRNDPLPESAYPLIQHLLRHRKKLVALTLYQNPVSARMLKQFTLEVAHLVAPLHSTSSPEMAFVHKQWEKCQASSKFYTKMLAEIAPVRDTKKDKATVFHPLPAFNHKDPDVAHAFARCLQHQKFTVVVFFRGGWSGFCRNYLRQWKKVADDIVAAHGVLIGVTSKGSDMQELQEAWGLNFPLISDKDYRVSESVGVTGRYSQWHDMYLPQQKYLIPPAVVGFRRTGKVIYYWRSSNDQHEEVDRPKPRNVMVAISKALVGEKSRQGRSKGKKSERASSKEKKKQK